MFCHFPAKTTRYAICCWYYQPYYPSCIDMPNYHSFLWKSVSNFYRLSMQDTLPNGFTSLLHGIFSSINYSKKVNQSHYRPEVPRGFQEVKVPRLRDMAQDGSKVVSLKHWPPLPQVNTPGTHFRWWLSQTQGRSAIGRIMSMKNSNGTIWNRTSALPIWSTAP